VSGSDAEIVDTGYDLAEPAGDVPVDGPAIEDKPEMVAEPDSLAEVEAVAEIGPAALVAAYTGTEGTEGTEAVDVGSEPDRWSETESELVVAENSAEHTSM